MVVINNNIMMLPYWIAHFCSSTAIIHVVVSCFTKKNHCIVYLYFRQNYKLRIASHTQYLFPQLAQTQFLVSYFHHDSLHNYNKIHTNTDNNNYLLRGYSFLPHWYPVEEVGNYNFEMRFP